MSLFLKQDGRRKDKLKAFFFFKLFNVNSPKLSQNIIIFQILHESLK